MMANEVDQRLKRYFHDAAELRACVQRNIDDFAYSSYGGTIMYMVDANVVRLFCNPAREQNHIRIFTGEGFHLSLSGTAIVAAEFLFSRGLAGQGNRPCFISESHFEELGSFVDQLVAASSSSHNSISFEAAVSKRGIKRIERLKVLADAISVGQTKAALEISQLLGEIVNEPLIRSVTEAAQWRRLLIGDLVRPLRLHEAATESVLSVTEKQSKPWTDLILAHDKARRDAGKPGKPKGHDQARRDATTLVQIERLNAAFDGSDNAENSTRCVLVTTDIVLYEAYALWFWGESNQDQRPERFSLRLPTQYIPLLNVAEMPNGIGFSDLVPRTRAALDSLLASIARADAPHYPHSLPFHAATEQLNQEGPFRDLLHKIFGTDLYAISDNDAIFDSLQISWNRAFLDAVTLNWELVQRFLRGTFGPVLEDLLSGHDDAVEAALLGYQRQLLEEVEQAHTQFMTTLNIAEMAQSHAASSVGPGRGPLAVRVKFDPVTRGQDVVSYLDTLLRDRDQERLRYLFESLRSVPFGRDFLFFSACVAFRCGQWALAQHYAARALEVTRVKSKDISDFVVFEIEHLIAVAGRFQLSSTTVDETSRTLLMRGAKHFSTTRDHFGVMRAYSELAALWIVVILRTKLVPAGDISTQEQILEYMSQARSAILKSAKIALEATDVGPRVILEVVEVQVFTNVICYEIMRRNLFDPTVSSICVQSLEQNVIERSLNYLRERLHHYPPVLTVEYLFLAAGLAHGHERDELYEKFEDALRQYRRNISHSSRTELDDMTIDWLAQRMKKQSAV
jgi:hypothetical protein